MQESLPFFGSRPRPVHSEWRFLAHDSQIIVAFLFLLETYLYFCILSNKKRNLRDKYKSSDDRETNGYGGGKPLAKILEEQADIYSFILHNMGLKFK